MDALAAETRSTGDVACERPCVSGTPRLSGARKCLRIQKFYIFIGALLLYSFPLPVVDDSLGPHPGEFFFSLISCRYQHVIDAISAVHSCGSCWRRRGRSCFSRSSLYYSPESMLPFSSFSDAVTLVLPRRFVVSGGNWRESLFSSQDAFQ